MHSAAFVTASALISAAIQRQRAEQAASAALAAIATEAQRHQVLLRELQHRVKNNFQIILSILTLQQKRAEHGPTISALSDVANRVSAIALAHDQLSPTQGLRTVNFAIYLRALCGNISQQLEKVSIETEAEDVDLSIERAVPLGLIVNELVTNSIKHAFNDAGGAIRVELRSGIGFGQARLAVSDNGRGIPSAQPEGSGLKLIRSLARQVGGKVEQESSAEGTKTAVVFPILP